MRAAIYARYSSEQQAASSISDQVRLCRKLCADQGWVVVEVFADEAMTGSTHLRPGFQALQQAAMNGGFDVIVAEALDRLSRDQEHVAALYKRMQYLGVTIFTRAEGEINELHIGLGGTMNALFLRHLAQKTHRGLEGRVRAGKSAGGLSYGYRLERRPLADGSLTTGERSIDPAEAAIVRRIFREYAHGKSARSIAIELNRDGIAPPRASSCSDAAAAAGAAWSFSTISGNWKRGTGILNNELYIGRLVWNRQRFVKDPSTGKRQARPNPPENWIAEEVPDLRIIDDDLWQQVRLKQGAIRDDILAARETSGRAPKTEGARRSRYLLSGLLACGCCGAGYSMISDSRYGCSAARNKGTCTNRRTIARSEVEERVLSGLREKLMAPELVAEFIREFQREAKKDRSEALAARAGLEKRLGQLRKEIANIVTAITQGMFHPSMKEEMDRLEVERAELEARLAAQPAPDPVAPHPGLADIYHRKVAALAEALNDPEDKAEAADLLRGLIEKVVIHPQAEGHQIELFGELGAILSLCAAEDANGKARSRATGSRQSTVVAGARNQRYLRLVERQIPKLAA